MLNLSTNVLCEQKQAEFSDLNQQQDERGILRSRATFTKLITDEIAAGIPSNRIVLGGFSQGGAMSIFTGVTTPHKLGGVFGLSCYLVLADKVKEFAKEANEVNKDTPFFMGHGDRDEVVKYKWGQHTAEFLRKELGHKVEFKTYRYGRRQPQGRQIAWLMTNQESPSLCGSGRNRRLGGVHQTMSTGQ
jgi:predicted esterase